MTPSLSIYFLCICTSMSTSLHNTARFLRQTALQVLRRPQSPYFPSTPSQRLIHQSSTPFISPLTSLVTRATGGPPFTDRLRFPASSFLPHSKELRGLAIRHCSCRRSMHNRDDIPSAMDVTKGREVLPTNVKPTHYNVRFEPDLGKHTFTGVVDIE